MRFDHIVAAVVLAALVVPIRSRAEAQGQGEGGRLRVVATQSTWGSIATAIGGDRVTVESLVRGDQDPHFVRPRPSLAQKLATADLFVSTGLDLELWAPGLVDLSGNKEIRSGQRRYVAVAQGVRMLDVPHAATRAAGDLHVYGNPHIQLSPLNARVVARNIATGLTTVDPAGRDSYARNYEAFCAELDRHLYGEELVRLMGADTLNRLAERPDQLMAFLRERQYKNRPLVERLGGWLEAAAPLRGKKAIAYHRSWTYFSDLFGLEIPNYVEPRIGIPPSPRHVEDLIAQMRAEKIGVILSENYFDETRVRAIADKVGARAVILPIAVGGTPEARDYVSLMDLIVSRLAAAFDGAEGARP
jgi:ABC-type Zn uptake system ZnuABC Zn-binding protein ZnuA